MVKATRFWLVAAVAAAALSLPASAQAQAASNLAPGFAGLSPDAKVLIAPIDVELFSISGGGVLEPKADWTEAAHGHMKNALRDVVSHLRMGTSELDSAKADEMSELLNLHAAVARSISIHHQGAMKLPTKDNKLDWTFGDVMRPLQANSGARYALFTWVRDSYTSAERMAMMIGLALLGVGVGGGAQIGYATLVDLETGQVLWFNQMRRATGDLRVADKAAETVRALLTGFPAGAQ